MSRETALVKNTIVLSLGTFLPKAVSFITLPILTAYLTKSEYGIYDLLLVLVSLLLPAATLQIQTAAFRYLITCRNDQKKIECIVTNIYAFIIPISIITLGILWFFLTDLSIINKILVLTYFFADTLYNSSLQIARGLGNNTAYSIGAIICSVVKVLFIFLGVFLFRGGLFATLLSLLVASLLSFFAVIGKAKIYRYLQLNQLNFSEIKKLISYSWPMVPNSMAMWVMNLSDRLIITAVLGAESNAVYAVATKIPQLLSLAQNTFTMAWQENASISVDDDDVRQYYSKMFSIYYDLMIGFCALLIASTPILFSLLIRGDYGEAYSQMPILYLGVFFSSISSYFGGIYVAYMKTRSVGITTIIAAAINTIVNLLLIRDIGIYAGSISTAVGFLFLALFRMINIRTIVIIKYDYSRILKSLILIIVMCLMCYQRTLVFDILNFIIGCVLFLYLNKNFIVIALSKVSTILKTKTK